MTRMDYSRTTSFLLQLSTEQLSFLLKCVFCGLLLVTLCNCAPPSKFKSENKLQQPQFSLLQSKYQSKVLVAEKRGDLYLASFYWWILANLNPDDLNARDRSEYLLKRAKQTAELHFQNAEEYIKQNRLSQGQTELLNALNYNPQHKKALSMINSMRETLDLKSYRVAKGESLHSIAMREYRNAEMAAVIANYNGLSKNQELKVGSIIELVGDDGPYLLEENVKIDDAVADYREVDSAFMQDLLQRAEFSYQQDDFNRAIAIAKLVLKDSQNQPKARDLLNKSSYQLAKSYVENGNELEALALLKTIDENYLDVLALKTALLKQLNEAAEGHYRSGVKFFLAEDLAAAAEEWKNTLHFNPDHERARKGLEKVLKMLERRYK